MSTAIGIIILFVLINIVKQQYDEMKMKDGARY